MAQKDEGAELSPKIPGHSSRMILYGGCEIPPFGVRAGEIRFLEKRRGFICWHANTYSVCKIFVQTSNRFGGGLKFSGID